MLDNRENEVVSSVLRDKFGPHFDFFKVKESPWGKVFFVKTRGDMYMLKMGGKQIDGYDVNNEYQALKCLKLHHINNFAPLVYFGTLKYHDWLLTRFIESTEEFDIVSLGRIFERIHHISNPGNETCYDFVNNLLRWLRYELKNIGYIPHKRQEKFKNGILAQVDSFLFFFSRIITEQKKCFIGSPLSFINGDNSGSIISFHKKIVIVDWHLARFGDPAWDLSRIFSYYRFSAKDREQFISGYGRGIYEDMLLRRVEIYSQMNRILAIFYMYSDEPDLVKYKVSQIARQNVKEQNLLSALLNKKIRRLLEEITDSLSILSIDNP